MLDHAERIEELISEVLANYAKENNVKIVLDSNYETGAIRIRIQVLLPKYI